MGTNGTNFPDVYLIKFQLICYSLLLGYQVPNFQVFYLPSAGVGKNIDNVLEGGGWTAEDRAVAGTRVTHQVDNLQKEDYSTVDVAFVRNLFDFVNFYEFNNLSLYASEVVCTACNFFILLYTHTYDGSQICYQLYSTKKLLHTLSQSSDPSFFFHSSNLSRLSLVVLATIRLALRHLESSLFFFLPMNFYVMG